MEDKKESSKLKIFLYVISLILFAVGFIPALESYKLVIYLLAVIFSGYDLIIEGIKNIFHGEAKNPPSITAGIFDKKTLK